MFAGLIACLSVCLSSLIVMNGIACLHPCLGYIVGPFRTNNERIRCTVKGTFSQFATSLHGTISLRTGFLTYTPNLDSSIRTILTTKLGRSNSSQTLGSSHTRLGRFIEKELSRNVGPNLAFHLRTIGTRCATVGLVSMLSFWTGHESSIECGLREHTFPVPRLVRIRTLRLTLGTRALIVFGTSRLDFFVKSMSAISRGVFISIGTLGIDCITGLDGSVSHALAAIVVEFPHHFGFFWTFGQSNCFASCHCNKLCHCYA